MSYAKIRPKRGTEYEWSTYNPVLSEGELAIQFPDTGIGTGLCKFKVGDGITAWNQLPYAFDGTAAASIDGGGINANSLIQIRTATANAWFNTNPILVEKEIAYCSDPEINSIKIGDGVKRWNQLPYIQASALIETTDSYDFGNEDGDEVVSLSDMEQYVTYNSEYQASPFDNYGDNTTPTPEPENPEEPEEGSDTEDQGSDDSESTPEEQPMETAGIKDLLKSAKPEESVIENNKSENAKEIVEEAPVKKTRRSRKNSTSEES